MTFNVSYKQITYLPDLLRFKQLKQLNCSNNKLTSLPGLNENLQKLYCWNNQLTSLPNLNENLQELYCFDNQLTSLPNLNDNLQYLDCNNNPIYKILNDNNLLSIRLKLQKLNNFKHLYYCLKFKSQFRKFLWEKVKEPKIMKHYNPRYLMENLKENDELEEILNSW